MGPSAPPRPQTGRARARDTMRITIILTRSNARADLQANAGADLQASGRFRVCVWGVAIARRLCIHIGPIGLNLRFHGYSLQSVTLTYSDPSSNGMPRG